FPQPIVRRNIDHGIPTSLEPLAHFWNSQGPPDLTPDHAADGYIPCQRCGGQCSQRIVALPQQPEVKATVSENGVCGHRIPEFRAGAFPPNCKRGPPLLSVPQRTILAPQRSD